MVGRARVGARSLLFPTLKPSANFAVERMAAGGTVFPIRPVVAAAIAHLCVRCAFRCNELDLGKPRDKIAAILDSPHTVDWSMDLRTQRGPGVDDRGQIQRGRDAILSSAACSLLPGFYRCAVIEFWYARI